MSFNTVKSRIRSYVCRNGRITDSQQAALNSLWPRHGLTLNAGMLDYQALFGRKSPCFLEIGFGSGQSLLALAKANPDKDYIGIETHRPGIGALLLGVSLSALSNIRVFNHDVQEVLENNIPDASLDGVQIFFPDPWPKRRHHARRLIQPAFLNLMLPKLKMGGILHLATDWQDYAKHMMKVLSQSSQLVNEAGHAAFAERSPLRPIITKFESRAIREGRSIWELQFKKV